MSNKQFTNEAVTVILITLVTRYSHGNIVEKAAAMKDAQEEFENYIAVMGEVSEAHCADAVANGRLAERACERIFDMLQQDDGEAFFEAEKFLKRERPDLYNRLHMGDAFVPVPQPTFADKVKGFIVGTLLGIICPGLRKENDK